MRKTTLMILSALFGALTALGAFLRIPTPISAFTFQTMVTAMAGCLLGRRWGAASQLIYVLLGLAGLPVFTAGGGLSALTHPTGGFILALIPMAWVCGWARERWGGSIRSLCLACGLGLLTLYAIGLPWMHLVLTVWMGRDWALSQTFLSGMVLFLPWDGLKLLLAVILCRRLGPFYCTPSSSSCL